MASEIVVALISGGAGLATGVIGTLMAPWAQWGAEKSRLRDERRVLRIQEWRAGVATLRTDEHQHGVPQRVRKNNWYEESLGVTPQFVDVIPDPDLVNVASKPWFRTLRLELPKKTLEWISTVSKEPVEDRIGQLPTFLDEAINSIERDKWQIT